jgi:hypothetical protein
MIRCRGEREQMATPNDAIEQLTAALEGVLRAEDDAGGRVLYEEHRGTSDPYGEVLVTLCRACGEVDGHMHECPVGFAERVLRRVAAAQS